MANSSTTDSSKLELTNIERCNADNPSHDLIEDFTSDQLESLRAIFKNNDDESLNKEEFSNAINSLFSDPDLNYSAQSVKLFNEINRDSKISITWTDFLDFLLEAWQQPTPKDLTLNVKSIIAAPHIKKETIVKIVLIETDKYFCYAMISKHGRVGIYDGNINFLTTYHLIMTREDINRKEEERRRRNRWVTDAIFCADILMFIATNSARSVVIYEASGLKHVPLWLILSTPNIIECFAYKSYHVEDSGQSVLFMGDDSGMVISFNFLQPKVGPLRRKHNDKLSLFYWDELPNEKDFLVIKQHGRLHKENCRHIAYFQKTGTIISCSRDPTAAVYQKHVDNKGKSAIFKMTRGASCFAYSWPLKVLITGSDDGILRVWNPIITARPTAKLFGHCNGIIDVQIMTNQKLLLSCSRDGVLKLWDLISQKCLQSISIKFPAFSVFGKFIEWGIQSIYPGPKRAVDGGDLWERSSILVVCCNYVACVNLAFRDLDIGKRFEIPVLPPPPLQNSVLVPKSWSTSDDVNALYKPIKIPGDQEIVIDPEIIEHRMEDLKFILEKDLFAENGLRSDINFKIATLEKKKLHMQTHVARGAPYLALDLYEIENIQLTPDLPVPNKRHIKNTAENVKKLLEGASARDLIFSESSSSKSPRSCRSSIVEFEY